MSDETPSRFPNLAEAETPPNATPAPTEYFTPPEEPSSSISVGASASRTQSEIVVDIETPVAANLDPEAANLTPVAANLTQSEIVVDIETPVAANLDPEAASATPAAGFATAPAVMAAVGRGVGRGGRRGGRGRVCGVRVGNAAAARARGQIAAAGGAHHSSTFGSLFAFFDRALDGLEGAEWITMASIICCSLAFVAVILILIIILKH